MKKTSTKLFSILLSLLMLLTLLSGCSSSSTKSSNATVTVRLNEVTRSVFYAPMYAAISQGFFKEEGIELDISTGQGADATVTNTQVT